MKTEASVLNNDVQWVHTAIIPAAGRGTRLAPLTQVIPKPLLPLLDTPAIVRCVEEAAGAGVERVLVVTPGSDWFDDLARRATNGSPVPVEIVHQPAPLGMGDAVGRAVERLDPSESWLVVLLPDVVPLVPSNLLRSLIELAISHSVGVVNLISRPAVEASEHGVVDLGPNGKVSDQLVRIQRVVEKPATWTRGPTIGVVGGRYVLPRKVCERLSTERPPAMGELGLQMVLDSLAWQGELYGKSSGRVLADIGHTAGYVDVWMRLAAQNPEFRQIMADVLTAWDHGIASAP